MEVEFEKNNKISGLHKYWGKKPIEFLIHLIKILTEENEIVLDPFLGSGLIASEILKINRKFIGIDLNPFSIEYSKFLLNLPSKSNYQNLINDLTEKLKNIIEESYHTDNKNIATHFIWNNNELEEVWYKKNNKKFEKKPNKLDLINFEKYSEYKLKIIREMIFFDNSRISTKNNYTFQNLFTGRALRNIELIVEYANQIQDEILKNAILLTLTSSVSQMSKLVFVINKRNNKISKNEVGSWAIGFWVPKRHFEINVWNCFINKANKFLKELSDNNCNISIQNVFNKMSNEKIFLINDDSIETLKKIPSEIISLILTDPPHGDRIPYLELSEIWNAILQKKVFFEKEIVVSNAKERNMTSQYFIKKMEKFMYEASRVLKPNGHIVIMHNSNDINEWQYLTKKIKDLNYLGYIPCRYSTNSLVQRNRKGSLNFDYALVYKKKGSSIKNELQQLKEWNSFFPKNKGV